MDSGVLCRMTFDLEREASVPKKLFRKLIMYPAIDLEVRGEMTEARPDYYTVVAEGEHNKLNEYTTYINGVTRVVAVLHPGQRECDITSKFSGEFVVRYLVPLSDLEKSVPTKEKPQVPSRNPCSKSKVGTKEAARARLTFASEDSRKKGEPEKAVVNPCSKSKVVTKEATRARLTFAWEDSKKKGEPEKAIVNPCSKSKEPETCVKFASKKDSGSKKEEEEKSVVCDSDDAASITMEPVNIASLRATQMDKSEKKKEKEADLKDALSLMEWPETEKFEESESILSRRKRRKK